MISIKENFTILDRQICDFRSIGITELYILSGHLGEKIEEYLRNRENKTEKPIIEIMATKIPKNTDSINTAGSLFAGGAILSTYGTSPSNLPAYIQIIYLLSPTNFLELYANSIDPGIASYFQPNYIPSDLSFPLFLVIVMGLIWAIFPVILAYFAKSSRRN